MRTLAAFIVDDEEAARRRLRFMLARHAEVEIAGEFAAVEPARRALRAAPPDVVFLDIQMPAVDGFALLDGLPPEKRPAVVFVTAHDKYAVRAFAVEAVDYLLKPFTEERFDAALARARRELLDRTNRRAIDRLKSSPAGPAGDGDTPPALAVRSAHRVTLIPLAEVTWIDAAHNRVRVHCGERVHPLHEGIGELEKRLDPRWFVRIHRSTLVNLREAREVTVTPAGQYVLVLANGQRLSVSRSYRRRVRNLWGNHGDRAGSGQGSGG